MRRRDHDAVCAAGVPTAIVAKDSVGYHRSRCVAKAVLVAHNNFVRREHLQCRNERGLGQSVGIHADEKRAGDAALFPVLTNRLTDGQNVSLVETAARRAAAMTGSAKGNALRRVVGIRGARVVGRDQARNVDEELTRSGFASQRMQCHRLRILHPRVPMARVPQQESRHTRPVSSASPESA